MPLSLISLFSLRILKLETPFETSAIGTKASRTVRADGLGEAQSHQVFHSLKGIRVAFRDRNVHQWLDSGHSVWSCRLCGSRLPCRNHPAGGRSSAGHPIRRRRHWCFPIRCVNRSIDLLCIRYKSTLRQRDKISWSSDKSTDKATVFEPQIGQACPQSWLYVFWFVGVVRTDKFRVLERPVGNKNHASRVRVAHSFVTMKISSLGMALAWIARPTPFSTSPSPYADAVSI